MAHILIDGYNLIGIAHTSLEKARGKLIENLNIYSELKDHNITVVFDGWKNGKAVETKLTAGKINVIYSRIGENADHVIKKILRSERTQWIVVSSDREISDYAARRDIVCISSEEFDNKLYSALNRPEEANDEISSSYEDEDGIPAKRKGNSRRPSKKLKKKIQALNKL